MTDNRTTELLRKLLDERGVEWIDGGTKLTLNDGNRIDIKTEFEMTNGKWTTATQALSGNLVLTALTPQQAIAATLGSGTCRNQWQWNSGFCCSECFYTVPFVGKFADRPFTYCPNCGRKVVGAE